MVLAVFAIVYMVFLYAPTRVESETVVSTPQVLARYPHDSKAFTQGLFVQYEDSSPYLVESTGGYGSSSLRLVHIPSGVVRKQYDLPRHLFGEGVARNYDDSLVMLTWKSRKGLVLSRHSHSFSLDRQFAYDTSTGQGWGIHLLNDRELVVSDGSATLFVWDAETLEEKRRIQVSYKDQPLAQLNELEVVDGYVYANVWFQPYIVQIDPTSGHVVHLFDCSAIVEDSGERSSMDAVLNGIAYDEREGVFYLTGKLWKYTYKVKM